MIIKKTPEIIAYLNRLKTNIYANEQNDYLDSFVDEKDEEAAKKELLEAGQQEFLDNKENSLFIDVEEWKNNPYIQNISFNNINNNHFRYEKVLIDKGYLFNADSIIDDKDRELKDWLKLRALNDDLETLFLYQDDKEWMMAVPSESYTNDPFAAKAFGNVVTFGLGIGYYVYMTLLNNLVNSITVIEKSKEVIELFNEIKAQFPHNEKINIIHGDAFDYFNEKFLKDFDYIYVDIWQSSDDGRRIIEKLLSQYNPAIDKLDFWIEDSCLNVIRTLIYLYYDEKVNNRKNKTTKEYIPLMNKVRTYFNNIDIEVEDVGVLKDYMYDRKTIRNILSLKKCLDI